MEMKQYISNAVKFYQDKKNAKKLAVDMKSFLVSGEIVLTGEQETELALTYLPRKIELFPTSVYIFCNFVVPSAVLGNYKPLLRIVPLPYSENDQTTIEFQRPVFIPLSELKLRVLQFEILTSDGRPALPFHPIDPVYLNLMFDYNVK